MSLSVSKCPPDSAGYFSALGGFALPACWFNPSALALKAKRGLVSGRGAACVTKSPVQFPECSGQNLSHMQVYKKQSKTHAHRKKKKNPCTNARHVAMCAEKHVDACASNQSFMGGPPTPPSVFPHSGLLSKMTETVCAAVSGQEPHSCLTNKPTQARQPHSRQRAG